MKGSSIFLAALSLLAGAAEVSWDAMMDDTPVQAYPRIFQEAPPDTPAYMVDNQDNLSGQAPVRGQSNGAVWQHSGSFDNYMRRLRRGDITGSPRSPNSTIVARQSGGYWLPALAPAGVQPYAGGDGYTFYRDVTDYGADDTGETDATEAINAAIEDGNRCGMECGNSFSQGAIVYFPVCYHLEFKLFSYEANRLLKRGTYRVCTPIIQLYYTQFIGDPYDRPVIKGCDDFAGIALMDTDPYIPNEASPDGSGVNWYINQNQFFRQIRNFVFDLTEMPLSTDEHHQPLVPTGLHWQVSQACSLQNLHFKMPTASSGGERPTHVGIFTENGSGGFVSDLTFEGGAIGWRVGSQQYTARGLRFSNCITAVQMIWDWGFNWQDIEVDGGSIAFNISGKGGLTGQGIGSISLIDSSISNVPIGILTRESDEDPPNIVIDNTNFDGVAAPVQSTSGRTLLGGSQRVNLWATGRRYRGSRGNYETGAIAERRERPEALLGSDGKLFTKSRPQYEDLGAGDFLIATDEGCSNDGMGDQTSAVNAFLRAAVSAGKVAYFPAGIYLVEGTVEIPVNSRIVGASWSQIQGTGSFFSDMNDPQVVVRVGQPGDEGALEMTDMIISAKGPTAGAIMVEWNVKASSNGAAGMWDSHIRVGGALGSDLEVANCPKFGYNEDCITASLLLHVTSGSSGYFENVWAWVADHDNDMSLYWEFDKLASQISLYSGRGMLIESQGPCWFYGTGSEHTVLYQYQLRYARDIYLGHIQTESPYFQPVPVAPMPFAGSVRTGMFGGDPTFSDCTHDNCRAAWGLRVLNSENVLLHSAGLYSWFDNYLQGCLVPENCQERMMEVTSSRNVAIYNIFTKGVTQVATGRSNATSIDQSDNKQGYTSEISVWIPLDGQENVVYLGPEVYDTHTAQCEAPCTIVLAPSPLESPTVILVENYTTSLEVGSSVGATFVVTTTTIVIELEPITITEMPQSNIEVLDEEETSEITPTPSVIIPESTVEVTNGDGETTQRVITFPPWPEISDWPRGNTSEGGGSSGGGTVGGPTSTWVDPPYTRPPLVVKCPATSQYIAEYNAVITVGDCSGETTELDWNCPATRTVGASAGLDTTFSLGCTLYTGTQAPLPTYTTWPEGELIPVEEDGDDDDDDDTTTCRLWFFFVSASFMRTPKSLRYDILGVEVEIGYSNSQGPKVCIAWGNIRIGGWRWNFPPGILPPGPPPIRWPPGVTITGNLPGPWPPVTIGFDGVVTYPEGQPTNCETETADICSTTAIEVITTTTSQRTITTTRTESTCATIIGCNIQDEDETVTTTSSCTGGETRTVGIDGAARATARAVPIQARAPCPDVWVDNFIVYPVDPTDVSAFTQYLQDNPVTLSNPDGPSWWDRTRRVQGGGLTAFFFIESLTLQRLNDINTRKSFLGVADIFSIHEENSGKGWPGRPPPERTTSTNTNPWEISLMSVSPGGRWQDYYEPQTNPTEFYYNADDSFGRGQVIYLVEDGINTDHPQFSNRGNIRPLDAQAFPPRHQGPRLDAHGTQVGSLIHGEDLGLGYNAELVIVRNFNADTDDARNYIHDRYLASLIAVLADVRARGNEGRSIVNMSFGWESNVDFFMSEAHFRILRRILLALDEANVVLVTATHNLNQQPLYRNRIRGRPSRLGNPASPDDERIDNLIVVSGVDMNTRVSPANPYAGWLAMAPGYRVHVAEPGSNNLMLADGASLAVPLVVSTIAYWRGLRLAGTWAAELAEPANVKRLVMYMHRRLTFPEKRIRDYETNYNNFKVPFIWTGRVEDGDCLVNPSLPGCPSNLRGARIQDLQPRGADCSARSRRARSSKHQVRQDGDSCPLVVSPGNGGNDGDPITYSPGTASPTCLSGCGDLCSGYYCLPTPTGTPPDYWDPEDPAHPPEQSNLPPLPPLPGPTSCTGSQVTTTTLVCNGPVGNPVCATSTICVIPPPPSTTRTTSSSGPVNPAPTNQPGDPNSPECLECSSDMGASNCPWWDRQCLLDECYANPDCQACNFDCEGLFDTTDPDGPECRSCSSDLGASECPAEDIDCLIDECRTNSNCQLCQFDCNGLDD
ncbi:hypothetical protein S40293_10065 [Stachybotrys chartarum IBT 40293]|nr:hypothetical protein S40293_10065 [Stachybotrys chartarum IBT 40293]